MQKLLIASISLATVLFVGFHHVCCLQGHPSAPAPVARDEAEAVLLELANTDKSGKAWQALGALYEKRGWLASAVEALRKAEGQPGSDLDLGRVLLKQGDLIQALAAAERARESGDGPDALLLLANVHKAAGRYGAAAPLLRAAKATPSLSGLALAAECDLLQLQRKLGAAKRACEATLKLQPIGDRDRPATERVLGLVYFFAADPRAKALHRNSQRGYAKLGLVREAAWLREHLIDDEAELTKDPAVLASLSTEQASLVAALRSEREPVWWRISDAELRLADLLRKQQRYEEARRRVAAGLEAFQRRPAGWETVPDYAAIFELQGMLASEQGDWSAARGAYAGALKVLEGNRQASFDTKYLRDAIKEVDAKIVDAGAAAAKATTSDPGSAPVVERLAT